MSDYFNHQSLAPFCRFHYYDGFTKTQAGEAHYLIAENRRVKGSGIYDGHGLYCGVEGKITNFSDEDVYA